MGGLDVELEDQAKKDDILPMGQSHTLPYGDAEAALPKGRPIAHGDIVTEQEERDLRRGLAQRHVSMIALAGECCALIELLAHLQGLSVPVSSFPWAAPSRPAALSVPSSATRSSASSSVPSSLRWAK